MTITNVGTQAGGSTTDASATALKAFGANVAVGSLIYATVCKFQTGGPAAIVAANCTITGTATITGGVFTLDKQFTSANLEIAVLSAIVTGAGTCTINLAGGSGGATYWVIGTNELAASSGWDAARVENSNTGSGTATPQLSGNIVGANGTGCFVGATTLDTGANDGTYSEQAAFTRIYRETDGTAHAVGLIMQQIVAVNTTDAIESSTAGAQLYAAAGVIYKEVSAGAGPKIGLMTMGAG